MQKYKQDFIEGLMLLVLFGTLAWLTYGHVEESMSLIKYHLQWGIDRLLDNYALYHRSFHEFIFKTSTFHPGNSEAGWRTAFYLWPLFLFCDLLGGVSLKVMCLFTVTTSLIFIGLFYGWVRGVWGGPAAFFAAFFLGFSAVFQELARSGSYSAYGLLIAMIWLLVFYRYSKSGNPGAFFFIGLLTALMWYGHGMLRCFTIVAILHILLSKNLRKGLCLGLLLLGMLIVLIPGFIIKVKLHPSIWANAKGHWYLLFFDRENVMEGAGGWHISSMAHLIGTNFKIFGQRMLGGVQWLEPGLQDRAHAPLWNPWLVIPLAVGMWQAFKSKHPGSRLLLLSGLVIYLVPCLLIIPTGEARRFLLYIIPSYCFIGLGMAHILSGLSHIKVNALKWLTIIILIGLMSVVLVSERRFMTQHILASKRDLGLLAFARDIKDAGARGDLYYLEKSSMRRYVYNMDAMTALPFGKQSVYQFAYESDIMRMALLDHGQSPLTVQGKRIEGKFKHLTQAFYAVKSPIISQAEFDDWCARNGFKADVLLSYPVTNASSDNETTDPNFNVSQLEPFKLYVVHPLL